MKKMKKKMRKKRTRITTPAGTCKQNMLAARYEAHTLRTYLLTDLIDSCRRLRRGADEASGAWTHGRRGRNPW